MQRVTHNSNTVLSLTLTADALQMALCDFPAHVSFLRQKKNCRVQRVFEEIQVQKGGVFSFYFFSLIRNLFADQSAEE